MQTEWEKRRNIKVFVCVCVYYVKEGVSIY